MKRFLLNFCLLLGTLPLLGDEVGLSDQNPWFSGTLLALFPENTPPGHFLIQTNGFATRRYGFYNSHSSISHSLNSHPYTTLLTLETGITKSIDVTFLTSGTYAHTEGRDFWHLGDTFVLLGFQLSTDKKGTWIPDIRILIGESFPTGKFQGLNPHLQGADATGRGVYETTMSLIIRKIFYTWLNHPYNWNFNVTAGRSTRIKVEGLSVFGGDPLTRGTIGSTEDFLMNLAFEYKLNQAWGCGIDCNFLYQNSASFKSRQPDLFTGPPSSYFFSLAPMLEYNLSENFGISGGVWFSVKGRNSFAFYSGVFSIFKEF